MEKQTALQILESRKLIAEAGKYRLTVSTCQDFFETRGEGDNQVNVVAIANFRAMTPYHVGQAKKLLAEGKHQEACNNNLSLSILDSGYKPAKGEQVDVIVEAITNKAGEKILVATSIIPVKAITDLSNVSFSMEEEPAQAGEAEDGDIA